MSETVAHKKLKKKAKKWLKQEYDFSEDQITFEYKFFSPKIDKNFYRIDVVGLREDFKVAIECGRIRKTSREKWRRRRVLKNNFDVYKHFLYTPKIYPKGKNTTFPKVEEKNRAVRIRTTKEVKKALLGFKVKKGYRNLHQVLKELMDVHPECDFEKEGGNEVKIHGTEEK